MLLSATSGDVYYATREACAAALWTAAGGIWHDRDDEIEAMFKAMEAGLASGDFEAQQLNGVLDALTASEDYLKFLKYRMQRVLLGLVLH